MRSSIAGTALFVLTVLAPEDSAAGPRTIGIVASAVTREEVPERTSRALTCARELAGGEIAGTHLRVLGTNGAAMRAWEGPLGAARVDTLVERIVGLVQEEPCHDLGGALTSFASLLPEGSEMVVSVRYMQAVLDLATGRCGPEIDILAGFPWDIARRRRIRFIVLVDTAIQKKHVEASRAGHGVGGEVIACARNEVCCVGLEAWPLPLPSPSWIEWLVERLRDLSEIVKSAQALAGLAAALVALLVFIWQLRVHLNRRSRGK